MQTSFLVAAFSLQFAGLCDSGSLPCHTHEWCSQFGSPRTNALQWIVQLCSDKHSLPLYLFPGLRRERRDKMHCAQSEHPYSYMYADCIVHRVSIHILICTLNVRETSDDWQTGIFNISCASRGLMHDQWTKKMLRESLYRSILYRSILFLWNHSLRTEINLHHCSPEETVRGERVK